MTVIITAKSGASDVVGCTVQCQNTSTVEWVNLSTGAESVDAIKQHEKRCPRCGNVFAEVIRQSYIHPPYVLILEDLGKTLIESLCIEGSDNDLEDADTFRVRLDKFEAEIASSMENMAHTEMLYVEIRINLLRRLINWCFENDAAIRWKAGLGR